MYLYVRHARADDGAFGVVARLTPGKWHHGSAPTGEQLFHSFTATRIPAALLMGLFGFSSAVVGFK